MDAGKAAEANDISASKAEERFRAIFEQAAVGISRVDMNGVLIDTNQKFCDMLGYSKDELCGKTVKDITYPEDFGEGSRYRGLIARGETKPVAGEKRFVRKDGTILWGRRTMSVARDDAGNPQYLISVIEDISERKQAEEAVALERALLRTIIDTLPDRIYVKDSEGRLMLENAANLKVHGVQHHDEIIGKTVFDLFPREVAERIHAEDQAVIETGNPILNRERSSSDPSGAVQWHLTTKVPLQDASGKVIGVVGVNRDITKRKQAEERLAHLAEYDALTGLPNRSLFLDRLLVAINKAERNRQMAALMFIDLDRFKEINDTLGHATGDKVLKGAAVVLAASLRHSDTVARLGGDEFTIILENVVDVDQVTTAAEKIKLALSKPILTQGGQDIFVSASIGITLYPLDANNVDALLQTADVAMYHAKAEGRNTYEFYAPALNQQAAGRLHMEGLLRRALEREEFVLHFQPKVQMKSGRIIGMEALIRWNSKELGLVSPGQFIPLAEKSGLIVSIGEWVLRTACTQNKAWQDQGFGPLLISVNLSPRQLQQKNLVELIAGVLDKSGLQPSCLELEITEGMIMQHVDKTILLLRQIHDLGVHLSVDDFGTGYSSMAYLQRLPVQTLKIDQSFIRDLTGACDDVGIVTAIIAVANSLKLSVVAEGVETKEQLACLASLHCDEYQGYYFSRPVPANAFLQLLQTEQLASQFDKTTPAK